MTPAAGTLRPALDDSRQQQIEFILGATRTGMNIIGGDFRLRYIDPEWKGVYGEPGARPCHEYYHGLSTPCPNCGMMRALQQRCVVMWETALPREGGRYVQITSIPFRDADGEWVSAQVAVDITERRRLDDLRRRQDELARGLLHNFPALIWRWNAQGRLDYLNARALRTLGLEPADLTADSWLQRVHPQDVERYRQARAAAVAQRGPFTLEYRLRRADGQYRALLDCGQPFDGLDGGFAGYLGAAYDVTDHSRREDQPQHAQQLEPGPETPATDI